MDKIQKYIKENHEGRADWFVEEVNSVHNIQRINKVIDMKEYLSGKHAILNRQPEEYNGKKFYPRKIVLQYAKTILNFQVAYLLQYPITLTGNENVVNVFNRIHKQGKYDRVNFNILDKVVKYGSVAEYVYLDGKEIKSKLIDPADSYPVFDHENNMLAFIEHYTVDGVSYYNVIKPDVVEQYNDAGGRLKLTGQFTNLSGLPIWYRSPNELSDTEGRSELEDIISILDSMEDLISKYTDAFYKFMNPIPIAIGQQLKGDDGLPAHIVGGGLVLDDGADFKMVENKLDHKTFETLYKTLLQSLLDVSSTPAVSMNRTDISNLSEVSIKLLFQLATIKAGWNEMIMRDGIEQRFEKIRMLLKYRDITFSDEEFESLDIVFTHAMPANNKEIIENLKVLSDMGAISLESILSHSPYTNDVQMELARLKNEKVKNEN